MFKKLLGTLVLLALSINVYGQEEQLGDFFVSGHSGMYYSNLELFTEKYGSNSGMLYGFSIGLPVGKVSYAYISYTQFAKENGIPIRKFTTLSFFEGIEHFEEYQDGSADFNQFTLMFGYQQRFEQEGGWRLGIHPGIVYTRVWEEITLNGEQDKKSTKRQGSCGIYLGLLLEVDVAPNLAVFVEPLWFGTANFGGVFDENQSGGHGGRHIRAGLRLYFR